MDGNNCEFLKRLSLPAACAGVVLGDELSLGMTFLGMSFFGVELSLGMSFFGDDFFGVELAGVELSGDDFFGGEVSCYHNF